MRTVNLAERGTPAPWKSHETHPLAAGHDWIPQGSLHSQAAARCSRCGMVRRYQPTLAGGSVRYSTYETVIASGPQEAVAAPACKASHDAQSATAVHWDVLTRVHYVL